MTNCQGKDARRSLFATFFPTSHNCDIPRKSGPFHPRLRFSAGQAFKSACSGVESLPYLHCEIPPVVERRRLRRNRSDADGARRQLARRRRRTRRRVRHRFCAHGAARQLSDAVPFRRRRRQRRAFGRATFPASASGSATDTASPGAGRPNRDFSTIRPSFSLTLTPKPSRARPSSTAPSSRPGSV